MSHLLRAALFVALLTDLVIQAAGFRLLVAGSRGVLGVPGGRLGALIAAVYVTAITLRTDADALPAPGAIEQAARTAFLAHAALQEGLDNARTWCRKRVRIWVHAGACVLRLEGELEPYYFGPSYHMISAKALEQAQAAPSEAFSTAVRRSSDRVRKLCDLPTGFLTGFQSPSGLPQ